MGRWLLLLAVLGGAARDDDAWMGAQAWRRDTAGPCVSLGRPGDFDDMHLFAPCVALEDGRYRMWYCGSRGKVADRVFALGLATSADGIAFEKHPASPVLAFADGRRSILTPALLRSPDGSLLREHGKLRLWFSSTDFPSGDGVHTLHESTSADGLAWTEPSEALLRGVYAPSILKDGDAYRMWFTDVSAKDWVLRHAESRDGRAWTVSKEPVLKVDQVWERARLFYPTVLKTGGRYIMWYGSYQAKDGTKTALGLAVSDDGLRWRKNPHNPVFGPDPSRDWESHYTTSQSVLKLADGRWRIWYAARTKPPFTHKYFAIGTAVWPGP